LQALYEKYQHDNLVVLSISLDRAGIATVKEFVDSQGLTFPTLHDSDTGVGAQFGVRGVPSTFFIDHQGRMLGMVTGPRPWDSAEADQMVQQLLQDIPKDDTME